MDEHKPPTTGSLIDGCFIISGIVESIDSSAFKPELAKIGVKDADGGFSILSVPRPFAQGLKLGDAVSLTVAVLTPECRPEA